MYLYPSSRFSQKGSSQSMMIWLVVIIGIGMIVKNEFFPGIKNGSNINSVVARLGQPVAKETIPRPT